MNVVLSLAGVLLIPLLIAYGVYWFVRRAYQMKALVEQGVEGVGRIAGKHRFRGAAVKRGSKRLVYEFEGPDGRRYQGRFLASDTAYRDAEPGDELTIVYLPDRPWVNARKTLVEQTRRGFADKAGKNSRSGTGAF